MDTLNKSEENYLSSVKNALRILNKFSQWMNLKRKSVTFLLRLD